MRRVWAMIPEKVTVSDMAVILESLASQLKKLPDQQAYIKRMRTGLVERGAEGHDQVSGIEIYVEGGEADDTC